MFQSQTDMNHSFEEYHETIKEFNNNANYKMHLCIHLQKDAGCQNGEMCMFAHNTDEIRGKSDPMSLEQLKVGVTAHFRFNDKRQNHQRN